nr:ATP-binding protein [Ardenticatena sp.]
MPDAMHQQVALRFVKHAPPSAMALLLPWLERLLSNTPLETLVSAGYWAARWAAARRLAHHCSPTAADEAVLWQLAGDRERFVREAVARTLAIWWQKGWCTTLPEPLTPRQWQTALHAVIALLEAPASSPLALVERVLIAALRAPHVPEQARREAFLALARHDSRLALRLCATCDTDTWETTADISVPPLRLAQVVGQPHALHVVQVAARQRRFVLLIGAPGTGKSMLGEAMAELLTPHKTHDVLVLPNPEQPVSPRIRTVPAGRGALLVAEAEATWRRRVRTHRALLLLALSGLLITLLAARATGAWHWPLITGVLAWVLWRNSPSRTAPAETPRLLVRQHPRRAPFVDATGLHAGALLGDVRHDPFQSGGRETPPHHLVEAGALHQAHGGVLFIDEVGTLSRATQQSLLSAIQSRRLAITGRSPASSGSMVRTDPVPCDVVLVLAGNDDDLPHVHPALRSRIQGYGYEVRMATSMPDTPQNRTALARFVAQEVVRDGRIPHFTRAAVEAIIAEAARRAPPGQLTLRLRELGGVVRAAGDQAVLDGAPHVEAHHVERALRLLQQTTCPENHLTTEPEEKPCQPSC